MKKFSVFHATRYALLTTIVLMLCITTSFAAETFPAGISYAGTVPMSDEEGYLSDTDGFISDTVILTDAAATRTYTIGTRSIKDLFVDILADKGATVVITPLIDYDDTTEGLASDTLTVVASTANRGSYSDIAAHKAKIVVTKTEAGDMTSYTFRVRGSVR